MFFNFYSNFFNNVKPIYECDKLDFNFYID